MPRTIRRPKVTEVPLDLEDLRDQVHKWYSVKQQSTLIAKKLNDGKSTLKSVLQRYGTKDDKGNLHLDLGGTVPAGERKIAQLKYQKSVTTALNPDAAERLLKRKGLWQEVTQTVEVLDQEKVWSAFYDNKLNQEDIDQMFTRGTSYSLILLDDHGKPVA